MARPVREEIIVQFIPTASYHEIETCQYNVKRCSTDMITTPRHNGQGFEAVFRATKEGLYSLQRMPYVLCVRKPSSSSTSSSKGGSMDRQSRRAATQV